MKSEVLGVLKMKEKRCVQINTKASLHIQYLPNLITSIIIKKKHKKQQGTTRTFFIVLD